MRRISIVSDSGKTDQTVRIRTIHQRDEGDLLRLWNDSAQYDPLTAALLEEKIQDDTDVEADLCLVAEAGDALVGFGVGVVRQIVKSRRGFVKLLAVDPANRRQGVASAVLDRLEAGMASRGATTVRMNESAPNYLTPGIDLRYSDGISFAESAGYERVGEAYNLAVDFGDEGIELATWPESSEVEVRRAELHEFEALRDFLQNNFWPSWGAEVFSALQNTPPSAYLALRDGQIIGFAAYDANNRGTGWFGPMGVAGDERHSGIGSVLLRRCLDDIQKQGHETAVIPWVDALPFYQKCVGAKLSRSFVRYEKKLTK